MKKYRALLLVLLLASPLGQAISLSELEQQVLQRDRRIEMADQDTRQALARQAQREAESGWSLFANANGGQTQEIVTDQSSRKYQTYGYRIGASYPLLGSRSAQQERVDEARIQVSLAQLGTEAQKRISLQELRLAYLGLWAAQAQEKLARAFLSERAETVRLLAQRRGAGLLLSSSEQYYLNIFSSIEAQVDAAIRLAEVEHQRIARLIGQPLPLLQNLDAPYFEILPANNPDMADNHPDILQAQLRKEQQAQRLRHSGQEGVEASLDFSFSDGRESWASRIPSRGMQAAINVRIPIEIGKLRSSTRDELSGAYEKSRLELEEIQSRTRLDATQLMAEYQSASANLRLAEEERKTAEISLRERMLRSQELGADELERKLQARHDYYRAARQQLVTWQQWQSTAIRLATLGYALNAATRTLPDMVSMLAKTNLPFAQSKPTTTQFAVPAGCYAWLSQPALQDPVSEIAQWKRYGLTSILLGLNRQQLEDPALVVKMTRLIELAHRERIRIELLLGDPDWILPEGRIRLVALLQKLSALPLDGINLDLEIEQLPHWEQQRSGLVAAWLATLSAASRTISWPLGATFHHRHLQEPNIGARLRAAGVRHAAVMIFSTNQSTTLNVSSQARQALDGLSLSLVQSIETGLPASESHAGQGLQPLVELSRQLQQYGHPRLLLQSCEELQRIQQ